MNQNQMYYRLIYSLLMLIDLSLLKNEALFDSCLIISILISYLNLIFYILYLHLSHSLL